MATLNATGVWNKKRDAENSQMIYNMSIGGSISFQDQLQTLGTRCYLCESPPWTTALRFPMISA